MSRRRYFSILALGGCALCAGSCAYVGAPRPPSLMIPVAIADLRVVERGDKLLADFTAPAVSTDGVALRGPGQIDLRFGAGEGGAWDRTARRIEASPAESGPAHLEIAVGNWVGQEIVARVRSAGKHGRFGEWSNAVRLKVIPPLERPMLKAEAAPGGVQLNWTPPPASNAEYRILKLGPGDQRPVVIATVKSPEYTDSSAEYGKRYEYSVEAFVKTGDSEARSDTSPRVSITPEDRFPPAVPSGLSEIVGVSGIDLSWNPNTEPDLRGYYVYRSIGGGPFERLGDLVQAPVYGDHAIESGKRYRYTVSAVDRIGNESARSEPVEAAAP